MELKIIARKLATLQWELESGQNLSQRYTPGFVPVDGFKVKFTGISTNIHITYCLFTFGRTKLVVTAHEHSGDVKAFVAVVVTLLILVFVCFTGMSTSLHVE
jgi:hypothetical protein